MTTLKRCALMLCILFGLLGLASLGCGGRQENISTVKNFESYEDLGNYVGRLVKGQGFSLGFGCGAPGSDPGGGSGGDSQTTVQTEGVDESDLVKVDDGFIFTVSYGDSAEIAILNARDNKTLFIPCDYTPVEFYVWQKKLVVFGTYYLGGQDDSWSTDLPGDFDYADLWDRNNVRVSVYDLSALTPEADLSQLSAADLPLERTVMVPNAEFVTTRRIENQVFLVLRSVNLFNAHGQTYVPRLYDDAGNFEGMLEIEDLFLAPHDGRNLQFVYLLSFVLSARTAVRAQAYFTSADMVYMTEDNLYLAFCKYSTNLPAEERRIQTTVLRFARDGGELTYCNYLLTDGFLTSSLALYERDGALFLALTTGRTLSGVTASSRTYVRAFDLNSPETRLAECGESEGVGAGYAVAGVSFSEDSCYVTTERESMVYLFDLADPTDPHLISQKRTMGINDYLFDLTGDGTVMLGIGQNKIGNTLRGIRVSIYRRVETEEGDQLTEVARYLNNDLERSVDLGQDYKAFLAWNGRYVFPFRSGRFFYLDQQQMPYEKYQSGALLLDFTGFSADDLPLTSEELVDLEDFGLVHMLAYEEIPDNPYATLDVVKRTVAADGKLYLIGNDRAVCLDPDTLEVLADIPLTPTAAQRPDPEDPDDPGTVDPDPEEPDDPGTVDPTPEDPNEPGVTDPDTGNPNEPDPENPDDSGVIEPDPENPNDPEVTEPDTGNPDEPGTVEPDMPEA